MHDKLAMHEVDYPISQTILIVNLHSPDSTQVLSSSTPKFPSDAFWIENLIKMDQDSTKEDQESEVKISLSVSS